MKRQRNGEASGQQQQRGKQQRERGPSTEWTQQWRVGKGGAEGAAGDGGGGRVARQHQDVRRKLPIWTHRNDIVEAVKTHQTTIVVGETGSGKSTQIPQFLYEAGLGIIQKQKKQQDRQQDKQQQHRRLCIACTQPRRVAAITVARRVAEEQGSLLGNSVGYSVRFEECCTPKTGVKFMTDGVLLREAMTDPLLSRYGVIILDEAHERSLQTDILFGLIKRLQPQRPDLRVVVMSATLDTALFSGFFADPRTVTVPGRTFPVDVMYTEETQDDFVDAAATVCMQIHEEEPPGDILVFLPGQEEINDVTLLLEELLRKAKLARAALLRERIFDDPLVLKQGGQGGQGVGSHPPSSEALLVPIYAALPADQQLLAFAPAPRGTRKIILATNIAETSITINGVRFVVDSGFVKARVYHASTRMESLEVMPVSRAQATQRAGRAGREAKGTCYRLFKEESFLDLQVSATPEIQRVNLTQVVLQLKVAGVKDPEHFEFVSPPPPDALLRAVQTLTLLGALDKEGSLTPAGREMAMLPLDPTFAHLLLKSTEKPFLCCREMLLAVSCLCAENVLYFPSKAEDRKAATKAHKLFDAYEGDLPMLVNILGSFEKVKPKEAGAWCRQKYLNLRSLRKALEVREQLTSILRDRMQRDPLVSCGAEASLFLKCLVSGLFMNVAIRQPAVIEEGKRACYKTQFGGREVTIHPSSVLSQRQRPPQCVVYTQLLVTRKSYMRGLASVQEGWLADLLPAFWKKENSSASNSASGGMSSKAKL